MTHSKNSSASNFDFDKKKTAYFIKGGVSPFPLTTQVLPEKEWTPEVVALHQRNRLEVLHRLWRLKVDLNEVLSEAEESEPDLDDDSDVKEKSADFHSEIIPRLEAYFSNSLTSGPNRTWSLPDGSTVVSCQVSKRYNRKNRPFWFGLKRSAKERLEKAKKAFCAFGLGAPGTVVLVPYDLIAAQLDNLRSSPDGTGGVRHWHIEFREDRGRVLLLLSGKHDDIDVSLHLLKPGSVSPLG